MFGRARSSSSGAIQYLPEGSIVVAVVDPGVGTDRRLLGVEVEGGLLLGPDNGLLAPAVAMVGGAKRVVELTNPDYQLPAPGATFAGRDILAPAAGHLATGAELDDLGPEVDAAGLVPGIVSLPELQDGGAIVAEVWWVDRFGNCQLNVDPDALEAAGTPPGGRVEVRLPRRGPGRSLGAYVRRRQAVGAGAARRLLRAVVARPRPRVGCRRARAQGRKRRHVGARGRQPVPDDRPPPGAAVRPATTITIIVLLALIFAAAVAQFFLQLGP